ncbi:MAG: hypothetical protein Q8L71_01800 [Thiobacillus sp.]|nr:hypothetical protein [Thiobacillus sp.]
MKNSLEKLGGEQAEQRRAEQDADNDLTAEAGGQDNPVNCSRVKNSRASVW